MIGLSIRMNSEKKYYKIECRTTKKLKFIKTAKSPSFMLKEYVDIGGYLGIGKTVKLKWGTIYKPELHPLPTSCQLKE